MRRLDFVVLTEFDLFSSNKSKITDRKHLTSGVATQTVKSVELFDVDVFDTGLFVEYAFGGVQACLTLVNKPARQCPGVFKGGVGTLDEKDFKFAVFYGENNSIDTGYNGG